jgi:DNA invertase Pin-like site-specific DNA recombinase
MSSDAALQKVTADHLKRDAYLYIRQSTLRQVFENTESTKRQYALRQRAVTLGWPLERTVVVDCDLGQSGASPGERAGFQRLVADVGMGRAGIVLGLEVSRLARNSSDWHRLLEICALTQTLILDEDGIYDPTHFNDRLLLGLKGTMSEAELHVLKARLRGGVLNKAKRGELQCPIPIGFTYDSEGRVVLDPDTQVQESVRLLFRTFRRTGSAVATLREFRQRGVQFPRRLRKEPNRGELVWGPIEHSRVLQILHNPRYAGAFVFGRSRTYKRPDGREVTQKLSRDRWHTLLLDSHAAYITWAEYEENQTRLHENAQLLGGERRRSPPREGPALLQGLVVCGICGARMGVRYHLRYEQLVPDYVCQRGLIRRGEPICQRIPGEVVDQAIGELLLESVSPLALEVSLSVQDELRTRAEEADRLRRKQLDRARYEADLARRRFMQVDPDHRLVADSLEAEWNQKLRVAAAAQEEYEQQRQQDGAVLDEQQRSRILALATDFPRLWRNPHTSDRERKRMVRLLLEDVTLIRGTEITLQVRFKGGALRTLRRPLPLTAWQMRQTSANVVAEIDRLLDEYTESQIAPLLNERGFRSGTDRDFNFLIVGRIRRKYGLTARYDRLRGRGMLTRDEMATRLGVCSCTVKRWRAAGLLVAYPYSDKDQYLYEPPGAAPPTKDPRHSLAERLRLRTVVARHTDEVLCEA